MADVFPIELTVFPLWNQQPEEDDRAFLMFTKYYLIMPKRSVRGAYNRYIEDQKSVKVDNTNGNHKKWNLWAKAYHWEQRADAYHRKLAQDNLEYFEEKKRELIERELQLANRLMNKVEDILNLPINDENVKIKDATTLLNCASSITRKALGMDGLAESIDKVNRSGLLVVDPSLDVNNEENLTND